MSTQEQGPERVLTVGLLAESELPLRVLERLAPVLPALMAGVVAPETRWVVKVGRQTLAIDHDGNIPLSPHADTLRRRFDCDQVVYLTDLPRIVDGEPLVAEIDSAGQAALISVPALGPLLHRRLRKVIPRVVEELTRGERLDSYGPLRGAAGLVNPMTDLPRPDASNDSVIELQGVRGYARLLTGMVRMHRPWRLGAALSGATAAAMAAGAFGIFYASIWGMANALSVPRLAGISLLAMAAHTLWLVVSNGLWDRRERRTKGLIYNASMLLTVAIAVIIMYLVLFFLLLLGALAVISGDYLQAELNEPVNLHHYLVLAWLATSMGTFAGALGSNWDHPDRVRQATFGRREYQRRMQTSGWELT